MNNPYTITGQDITEALQTICKQLEAEPAAVDALALAGLEDFTRKRAELGHTGDLTPALQHRAIARYAYLTGYALALEDTKTALEAVTGDAGDFLLRVESEGMAPVFQPGDVLEIRPAAFTEDIQQRAGAVIRKDGRFILGRAAVEKDGSGTLYSGATVTPFTEGDFVGYVVARRCLV